MPEDRLHPQAASTSTTFCCTPGCLRRPHDASPREDAPASFSPAKLLPGRTRVHTLRPMRFDPNSSAKSFPTAPFLAPGVVLGLFLLLGPAGCGPTQDAPSDAAASPVVDAEAVRPGVARVDVYSDIQGVIAELPNPDDPRRSLRIRHTAIPGYRSAAGEVVGMSAMTMPFPRDEGLSLDGLEVGTPVVFDFEVRVTGPTSFTYAVTRIAARPLAPSGAEDAPPPPPAPPAASDNG